MSVNAPRVDNLDKVEEAKQPFHGDAFDRKRHAERLTAYVERLKEGSVLAIDAPWGEGKTWFAKNWARYLDERGHRVVYIDAFESDYLEDPFLLIVGELTKAFSTDAKVATKIQRKAAAVVKNLLPLVAKVGVNTTGRILLGTAELSKEYEEALKAVPGAAAEATQKAVEKMLKNYESEKASVQHFREEIATHAGGQEKPVIVLIDELDRCRPTFAIRLLERVKHFFQVPNVVFVLMVNRSQLETSVHSTYGKDTDAAGYLNKFVNFFLGLPRPKETDRGRSAEVEAYLIRLFEQLNIQMTRERHDTFISILIAWSLHVPLTLRDLERIVPMYVMAGQPRLTGLACLMLVLKVKEPALFSVMKEDRRDQAIVNWIEATVRKYPPVDDSGYQDYLANYFQVIRTLVHVLQNSVNVVEGDMQRKGRQYLGLDLQDVEMLKSRVANMVACLDLSVD